MDVRTCEKCNTPLDDRGECVTCRAEGDGMILLSRSGYASVKEMLELLEEQGVDAEIEPVPARRPEEMHHPLWNLYAPEQQVSEAVDFLRRDWAELLSDASAVAAAERGRKGIDLDVGGEIECPACGRRFEAGTGSIECPDCGLVLGERAEGTPDEGENR